MPRIAKWREKYECVKISAKPVKFFLEDTKTDYFEGRMTLDEITESFAACIDQVVEDSIKNSLRFDQFVEVKNLDDYVCF
jgi:hypothetical protein